MQTPTSFADLYELVRLRLVPFLAVFFACVFFTYLVLFIVDFYPEPVTPETTSTETTAVVEAEEMVAAEPIVEEVVAPVVTAAASQPLEIIFDDLNGKKVTVLNPQTSDIPTLDAALLSGVVRHPQSADFSKPGNIFILGHSSYLPNVLNKNFQAFNGIQELTWGDTIRLRSSDAEYVYRVDRVYKASATEVVVPTDITEAKLTLATCNSFGSKDDRYMVEATLVNTVALAR